MEMSETPTIIVILSCTHAYSAEISTGSTTTKPDPPSMVRPFTWPLIHLSFPLNATLHQKRTKIPEIKSMIKSQWFIPDLVAFYSLFSSHIINN
jgi:hypothetical protein